MKYLILITLLVSGCAGRTPRGYVESTSAEYIGNDQYAVSSYGTRANTETDMQVFFYKKAFETCYLKGKGFQIVSSNLTSVETGAVRVHKNVYKTRREPQMTGTIRCEGNIDLELISQYGVPKKPTNEVAAE